MDEKLLRFRREKAKQQIKQNLRNLIHKSYSTMTNGLLGLLSSSANSETDEKVIEQAVVTKETNLSKLKIFTIFTFWAFAYIYFIYVEFGAVYFCITALIFIYYNTRTTQKLKDEISAYSVFNENCEKIDGTFAAEQFEKQIRSGIL